MPVCSAIKANGQRCKLPAAGTSGFCCALDSQTSDARSKRASGGGQAKAARRVGELWEEIRAVIDGVESERLSPPQGNSMLRGFNSLIALARLNIEQSELEISQRRLELDEEERTELVGRMEALEQALIERKRTGGSYGA